jgi:hypothetical protein
VPPWSGSHPQPCPNAYAYTYAFTYPKSQPNSHAHAQPQPQPHPFRSLQHLCRQQLSRHQPACELTILRAPYPHPPPRGHLRTGRPPPAPELLPAPCPPLQAPLWSQCGGKSSSAARNAQDPNVCCDPGTACRYVNDWCGPAPAAGWTLAGVPQERHLGCGAWRPATGCVAGCVSDRAGCCRRYWQCQTAASPSPPAAPKQGSPPLPPSKQLLPMSSPPPLLPAPAPA